ncbi:MAG: hypothetical protein HY824_09395 [Acidobacteria bacterium]|nr:hypothetical protein [Acidobacteriota bacterium]
MHQRALFVCLLGMSVAVSGCFALAVARPEIPGPEPVSQPTLQTFMRSVGSPTIVLRVPSPQSQVTEAQKAQGDAAMNQAYNLIERELVKAGFTVRDRGLLEAVLRSNQDLDYRLIQQKVNAQLIIEFVSISTRDYSSDQYLRVKDQAIGRLESGAFPLSGWQFECKVILVDSGEIGGIYTIHIAPQQNYFLVSGNTFRNASPQGRAERQYRGYGLELSAAIEPFVRELIFELKPWTRTPNPVTDR